MVVVRSTWCEYLTLVAFCLFYWLIGAAFWTAMYWQQHGWGVLQFFVGMWMFFRIIDWIFMGATRRAINAHWGPIENPQQKLFPWRLL